MTSNILYIFTRTPLHVGAGNSVGAIDQPVTRERHTGFPIIPGSSIKGVMRDQFGGTSPEADEVFGKSAGAGDDQGEGGILTFAEARVIAFPLRAAIGSFAMITCPLALRRYSRDAGIDIAIPDELGSQTCLAGSAITMDKGNDKGVVLEEYAFKHSGDFPEEWINHLTPLLDDAVLAGSKNRFALLSDGDFAHFVATATQVNQHVRIDDETGTAQGGGLFNEETVPSETLFYSFVSASPRRDAQNARLEEVLKELSQESLTQFGGKNTTGLGFCTTKLV